MNNDMAVKQAMKEYSATKELEQKMEEHITMGLGMRLGYTRTMWEAVEACDPTALNAEIARAHAELVQNWQEALDTQPQKTTDGHWYGWVYEAKEIVASEPPFFVG